jgi:hypothetical protein
MRTAKILKCQGCGKDFRPKSGHLKQKFCSKECGYKYCKKGGKKGKKYPHTQRARIGICPVCGKEFRAVKDYTKKDGSKLEQKYCSKECWESRGNKNKEYTCNYCGGKFIDRVERKYCSQKCSHSDMVGDKAPRFKDGKSLERNRARMGPQLREWRTKVYIRDNRTCQKCGSVSSKIHAHHIKSFAEYPDLRFDVNNGITLCVHCHGKEHNRDFSNFVFRSKKSVKTEG